MNGRFPSNRCLLMALLWDRSALRRAGAHLRSSTRNSGYIRSWHVEHTWMLRGLCAFDLCGLYLSLFRHQSCDGLFGPSSTHRNAFARRTSQLYVASAFSFAKWPLPRIILTLLRCLVAFFFLCEFELVPCWSYGTH